MKKSFVYIAILNLLFFAACEKDLLVQSSNNVVFFVDAVVDGNDVSYHAGDDGFYMLPSFSDDTLGIRSFSGRVGQLDCDLKDVCPNSFEVIFREGPKLEGAHVGIEQSLAEGPFAYRGPASFLFESYKASFTSTSFPDNLAHEWFFGDGSSSIELNPVHYYVDQLDTLIQPVLNVTNSSGSCVSSISYDVNLLAECKTDIIVTKTGVIYGFSAYPSGRSDLWDFGSGYLPLGSGNPLPSGPVYNVCLRSLDTVSGCLATKCENVIIDSIAAHCVSNFDVNVESVLIKDVRDYAEVTLVWQDDSGKKYQSDLYGQPQTSYFEILKIEDYKDAENSSGTSTKKLTIAFSMRLYGDSNEDFVHMESDSSVIAVGYPKI